MVAFQVRLALLLEVIVVPAGFGGVVMSEGSFNGGGMTDPSPRLPQFGTYDAMDRFVRATAGETTVPSTHADSFEDLLPGRSPRESTGSPAARMTCVQPLAKGSRPPERSGRTSARRLPCRDRGPKVLLWRAPDCCNVRSSASRCEPSSNAVPG